MRCFRSDDEGYLSWVRSHGSGFVVNVDDPQRWKNSPMVHRTSHGIIKTPRRENYTTKRYYKVCSDDLDELEAWSKAKFAKRLTPCCICM